MEKTKKIILLTAGLGVLATAIAVPIIVINNKESETNKPNELSEINLLKNSNITNEGNVVIFQDKFKNIWTMGDGTSLQVLKINDSKNKYVDTGWTSNNDNTNGEALLKNSNIVDGEGGVIFQDEFKNLWTVGRGTPLQVLKVNSKGDGYVTTGWTSIKINYWLKDHGATSDPLLKGSNIVYGERVTIFQDKFKNLWTMQNGAPLQVLKVNSDGDGYVTTGWTSNSWTSNNNPTSGEALLKNSNIVDGEGGVIFQDEFKNLWTMGRETPLQVLKVNSDGDDYVTTGWVTTGLTSNNTPTSSDPLLRGSNIVYGESGTIFQDEFKNLWAMGNGTPLQVLKVNSDGDGYVTTGWTSNNDSTSGDPLLKGSNIVYGGAGTIFQDEFKNLWAMGAWEKLQVLKVNSNGDGYVTTGWTSNNDPTSGDPLLKGSNIINDNGEVVSQGTYQNWLNGSFENWKYISGSNDSGEYGTIFQDQFKNLWAMRDGTPLQVLKVNSNGDGYVTTGWTSNNDPTTGDPLLKGSNILDGEYGTIFQDSFKNLWAINAWERLQVLKVNSKGDGYVDSWQD